MRLKLDARTRAILRRLPVVNIYSVLELLLLAGLAAQCARLVWTIATPMAPLGDWRPTGPAIPAAPGEILRGFDPFFRISGPTAGPAAVTSLSLQLFGTRTNEATGRGSAIIAGPDNIQKSIAVGEEIAPGVTLKSVAFDHVTIDRNGVAEDLFLDQSNGATPIVPGEVEGPDAGAVAVPAPPAAASAGIGVAQLRTDIGFIPRVDGGRISGLVVRAQGSGAAFRAAGLADGDIVTAIGGRPVTGQDDLGRIATDYAKGGTLPITVERGGRTLPLSVAIAPR